MEIISAEHHFIADDVDLAFPTRVVLPFGRTVVVDEGDTAFGFVRSGVAHTKTISTSQMLHEGMFFALPGPATVSDLHGFICIRKAYRGLPMWGGPIETLGRLKYIDGCSDTLLLCAPLKGDPCVNYLYIPPGVNQTGHTHPSVRVGCIIGGAGVCQLAEDRLDLRAGDFFILPPEEFHSFHTITEPLRVIVYHPDSDFGPTDDNHPMINRTIIDDVPAAASSRYRTQEISEFVQ